MSKLIDTNDKTIDGVEVGVFELVNISSNNDNALTIQTIEGNEVFNVDTGATPEVVVGDGIQLRFDSNDGNLANAPILYVDSNNTLNITAAQSLQVNEYLVIKDAGNGGLGIVNSSNQTKVDIYPDGNSSVFFTKTTIRNDLDEGFLVQKSTFQNIFEVDTNTPEVVVGSQSINTNFRVQDEQSKNVFQVDMSSRDVIFGDSTIETDLYIKDSNNANLLRVQNGTFDTNLFYGGNNTGSTSLLLASDSNDTPETDNTDLWFIQDGGTIANRFGCNRTGTNNNFFFEGLSTTGATNDFVFSTGGTISGAYTFGTKPTISVAPTERFRINSTNCQFSTPLIVDNTNAEALLVRKANDTGDILNIDTSTPKMTLYDGGIVLRGNRLNSTIRPALALAETPIDGEIRLSENVTLNHGLLRIGAGGGSSITDYTGIDMSAFHLESLDMEDSMVFYVGGYPVHRLSGNQSDYAQHTWFNPYNIPGTGTISSSGTTVTGVGTLFTTQVKVGDYIFGTTRGDFRIVTAIASPLSLTVQSAFASDIPAGTAFSTKQPILSMNINHIITANAVLEIQPRATPSPTTDRLYNSSGNLFWNGGQVNLNPTSGTYTNLTLGDGTTNVITSTSSLQYYTIGKLLTGTVKIVITNLNGISGNIRITIPSITFAQDGFASVQRYVDVTHTADENMFVSWTSSTSHVNIQHSSSASAIANVNNADLTNVSEFSFNISAIIV